MQDTRSCGLTLDELFEFEAFAIDSTVTTIGNTSNIPRCETDTSLRGRAIAIDSARVLGSDSSFQRGQTPVPFNGSRGEAGSWDTRKGSVVRGTYFGITRSVRAREPRLTRRCPYDFPDKPFNRASRAKTGGAGGFGSPSRERFEPPDPYCSISISRTAQQARLIFRGASQEDTASSRGGEVDSGWYI